MFQPYPCKWDKCIDPPSPTQYNIVPIYASGQTVDFYEHVTYTCSRDGLWFEHDRGMASLTAMCLPDGSWDLPSEWPRCVSGNVFLVHVSSLTT